MFATILGALCAVAMASTPAVAQPGGSFLTGPIGSFLPLIAIFVIFYFLLIRPQQKRAREHREMVAAVRRGDVAVTAGGLIGKVIRVTGDEVVIEFGEGDAKVRARAVKATLQDVRSKTEPVAANDSDSES